jgi:hypothetical protein
MNDRLGVELGRMSQIILDFSIAGKQSSAVNNGNVDLQFWGYKVGNGPDTRATLLKRSAVIENVGNILDELRNGEATKSRYRFMFVMTSITSLSAREAYEAYRVVQTYRDTTSGYKLSEDDAQGSCATSARA